MPVTHRPHRTAFTLVELSIVLVIVGLLIGGILSGRGLMRAAELRSAVTEHRNFETAANTFREKFRYWPGDFPDAYELWGNRCGDNSFAASTGCNGTGDDYIFFSNFGEAAKVWEHLSLAGLIAGKYDGTGTLNGVLLTLSPDNSPQSKLDNGLWGIGWDACQHCKNNNVGANSYLYRQTITLGVPDGAKPSQLNNLPGVTLEEAWGIDKKVDDGRCVSGKLNCHGGTSPSCNDATGDDPYCIGSLGAKTKGRALLNFTLHDTTSHARE